MRTVTGTETAGVETPGDGRGVDDVVSSEVRQELRERPWVVTLTRVGWLAKAAVYTLMGVAAISIARGTSGMSTQDEEASPEGAVDTVRDAPAGRVLLAALAIGLVLYVAWRLLSVAVLRGNDLHTWLERIGYTFSAAFYTVLAWVSANAALRGSDPGRSTTIEDLSSSALESTAGRWLLGLGGLVTIVVGLYFAVAKGIRRGYRDDLELAGADRHERRLIDVTGVIGWIGRGVVTALVGLFVLRAAVEFDAAEARGFDLALREVADTTRGSWLVFAAGIGLVVYGVFCAVTSRRQALRS